MSTMSIDAALEAVQGMGVIVNDYNAEALDTLCNWVEWKLKQDNDEWEREEEWTRNKEDKQ
mgnify:CR=1 FL=1